MKPNRPAMPFGMPFANISHNYMSGSLLLSDPNYDLKMQHLVPQ